MYSVGIGRRRGPMIIRRSSAPAHTGSIRFSAATTSAAFHQGTPVESSDSRGVWVFAMPGTRVLATVLAAPMLVSLVAMNYHFVSDVIAGSVLGALVAVYAVQLARLKVA